MTAMDENPYQSPIGDDPKPRAKPSIQVRRTLGGYVIFSMCGVVTLAPALLHYTSWIDPTGASQGIISIIVSCWLYRLTISGLNRL